MIYEVELLHFGSWVESQTPNSKDTAYQVNIIDIDNEVNPMGSIRNALQQNSTIYIDLSPTIRYRPTGMDNVFKDCTNLVKSIDFRFTVEEESNDAKMYQSFYGCTSLISTFGIPNGVTTLQGTYSGCTSLQDINIPTSVKKLLGTFSGCTQFIITPILPDTIEEMIGTFSGCTNLITVNNIPSNVTTMAWCFSACSSLLNVPLIPNSVEIIDSAFSQCSSLQEIFIEGSNLKKMSDAFWKCTALTSFRVKNFVPSNFTDLYDYSAAFNECSNIENFGSDTIYDMKEWIRVHKNNISLKPSVVGIDSFNFYFFSDSQPAQMQPNVLGVNLNAVNTNTASTPYNINITGITANNLSDIKTSLLSNSTKYVNLGTTQIPDTITDLSNTFEGCSTLIVSPQISDAVTDLTECFKNCSNLEEIPVFEVPLSVLESDAQDCFYGCSSLESIGIPAPEIEESDEWHLMMLNFSSNTVKGRVYDSEGNYETIPETTIIKDKLTLPIMTDELLFTTSLSEQDLIDLIEDVLEYRYSYFNKTVIPPNNKSFVMYAEEPEHFVSNIDFGGGGGVPIGFVGAYYGTTDPDGWFICNGRDTTGTDIELETYFPALYAFLGNSNVLPDLRECVIVGIGQNSTHSIATHDVYTMGEFKDDQMQEHTHSVNLYCDKTNGEQWSYRTGYSNYWHNTQATGNNTGRKGNTTHGKQFGLNYIIKAS